MRGRSGFPVPDAATAIDPVTLTSYARVFAAIPEPILLVDATTQHVVDANDAAVRCLRLDRDDILGHDISRFFTTSDAERLSTLRRTGTAWPLRTHSRWSLRAVDSDGDTAGLEVHGLVALGSGPAHIVSLDGTRAMGPLPSPGLPPDFAYSAFHDLKEPLALIRGYLKLLQPRLAEDKEGLEFLDTASACAERVQRLISGTLDLVNLDRAVPRIRRISLEEPFAEALANLQLASAEAGATITHDRLPDVEADPTLMTRLFQNLLSNALKFHAGSKPQVTVKATRAGPDWLFRVEDNGIGIPDRERELVFEPFHRLHSVDAFPGTGLGLTTCRRIVEAHGGRIWAEKGAGGVGTTVLFTLPRERPPEVD
ncbi:MAG: ATP-binding protein [Thermoplasmatota archaeon]